MNKIIHSKIAFLCFKYLILFKSVVAAGSSKPCLLIEQLFYDFKRVHTAQHFM